MRQVLMTVKLDPAHASIEDVMRKLNLSDGQIDRDFGVVNIDPERQLYTIMVDAGTAEQLSGRPDVDGPHANPKIAPFGPVR